MNTRIIFKVLWLRRQLRRRDRWTRRQLEEHHTCSLRLLREHAYARSPFYLRGQLVAENGKVLAEPGGGRFTIRR